MFIKILEYVRIAGVGLAFYLGYQTGFGEVYDPEAQLHLMIPLVIFFVAGLSGLEGLFFSRQSAALKGFETGSNYQIQSAIALLGFAFSAALVWWLNWGIKAELSVFSCFLFFFIFSAVNHSIQAVKHHNFKFENINRPFLVILLLGGFFYPLWKVWPLL
ncbi:MAG: hypothetical protein KJ578_06320 [Bacteroidetes bacterium]|nr:hypothetical protein [Bacteroidota bacterium]MBU1579046.1 hypothetical protein [Bacteroidota bacterium]MBU2466370.1 hypothetical protein [Bacteroidota bacterium]MBU2557376.1 hypothetical protein [Bacteroidota bacterium]